PDRARRHPGDVAGDPRLYRQRPVLPRPALRLCRRRGDDDHRHRGADPDPGRGRCPHARPGDGALRHDLPRRAGGRRGADGLGQRAPRPAPAARGRCGGVVRVLGAGAAAPAAHRRRARGLAVVSRLFCFGLGYSARALVARLGPGWPVGASTRGEPPELRPDTTHILVSIPPDETGDPVVAAHAEAIAALPRLAWLGYLSATAVYGDRGGGWVDETAELRPSGPRGRRRLAAIYGPGRSPFDALRAGTAKRIDRPGQLFSRIHVDDLAAILAASMARPRPGAVYNVCDDEPAAPEAVTAHAARLLGVAPPPLVALAAAELSPLARSFWDDNKRVSNALVKREL